MYSSPVPDAISTWSSLNWNSLSLSIPETAAMQARREKVILDACKDKNFTLAKLKKAYRAASDVK